MAGFLSDCPYIGYEPELTYEDGLHTPVVSSLARTQVRIGSKMSAPRVSVVMPLYNTRRYVAEAIDSILAQTFKDFELIVVDNGSNDGSREYALSLSDPRIRVITESARGSGMATNAGVAASRAELIAIMDSDDVAHPERLRLQTEFMDANPEVVLLGTRFAFLIGSKVVPVPAQPREHDQIRKALMNGPTVICNPSLMARTRAVRAVGGNHVPGPGADHDLFLRLSEVGKLHNLPTLLHYYRLHGESSSVVGMMTVKREHAYGLACAVARANAVAEPNKEEFVRFWSERSARTRARERADCKAYTLYRNAIVMRAQGLWMRSVVTMIHAAILNPTRTVWHLKRRLGLC
jgi:glycosyltransferase involved in cell wall biosynthesis